MTRSLSRHGLTWLAAFWIPFIIMVLVFANMHVAPFGPRSLQFSDLQSQYVPLFQAYRHHLLTHSFNLFSFSLSVGGSTLPLAAYYLMSPFNLLVVFFPAVKVPIAIVWIIILKISTIGLTMAILLTHLFPKGRSSIPLFSTAFALCGFVALDFYNVMWLDALIWLPIVTLGLYRIIEKRRFGLFTIALTITIFSNYYLGYMTGLFSIIYFGYLLISNSDQPRPLKQVWREGWPLIRQFVWGGLLAVGLSAVLLIPTGLGMLATGKTTFNLDAYNITLNFGPEIFTQFGIGGGQFTTHLYHGPALYMGSLMFLLVIVFFVSPRIAAPAKNRALWLLGILFVSLWITVLNTIWHMFQMPEGFPFRNAFFFTFVCIIIAYQAWQTHPADTLNDPQKILALAWGGGLLLIGMVSARIYPRLMNHFIHDRFSSYYVLSQPSARYTWIAIGLLVLNVMLLFISEHTAIRASLMALILFSELGVNFSIAMNGISWTNQSTYAKAYQAERQAVDQVKPKSPDLYRIDFLPTNLQSAFTERYSAYNDPITFGYAGIGAYSSTLEAQNQAILKDLGFFNLNERRVSSEGATSLSDLLTGTKYRLSGEGTSPADIQPVTTYAGMGYSVPKGFVTTKLFSDNIFANYRRIMTALDQPNAVRKVTVLDRKETSGQVTLTVKSPTGGTLYGYASSKNVAYSSIDRDADSPRSSTVASANGGYLLNLGHLKPNQATTISYTIRSAAKHDLALATLNEKQVQTAARALRQRSFTITSRQQNGLTGTVTGTRQAKWLYLSIPDLAGWHATVNGKPVHISSALTSKFQPATKQQAKFYNGMMALPLSTGKNKVVLRYQTPGLNWGLLVSAVSLILFLGSEIMTTVWHRRD
ncbi:YfhO family protein [Levilactobacillus bambusae]|uniref:YfhO family protein n=1 Tax=Levilactobacillus bambusae TaxID=2024736 RepID=A0A2V1MZC3_9LACO|nr:YfhO family protein [Levilactobacillus bambusae]PWG00172.1 hypothetical protein DCM90_04360 [Levilactobacillus bambusae]